MAGIQMRIVFHPSHPLLRRYSRMLFVFRQSLICEDPIVDPRALKVNIDNIAGLRFSLLSSQSTNSFCIKLVSLGKGI